MNTWISLARLETSLGQRLSAEQFYQQVFNLAEQVHFANHPVVQEWRQEYAQLNEGSETSSDETLAVQQLAEQLIAWIQTPDWARSQAFLEEHAAGLLTDEAEQVLALLQAGNPQSRAIPQHQVLLKGCRASGIESAYLELRRMS